MSITINCGKVKGDSAYDYAKAGGYTGTEEEFKALMAEPMTETKVDDRINDYLAENIDTVSDAVKEKIGTAVNSVNSPFETAYWKDSSDGNIYLVTMVNGSLSITRYIADESENSGEDLSGLEDLLTDRLLIWHDEFDGTEIDETKWKIGNYWGATDCRGDDPNNSCYQVNNSILTLSARPSDSTDITKIWYSSAMQSVQEIRKGHVQAKIKIVSNPYTNNAFWLNAPDPWPVSGEIDMLETSGYSKFEGAIHYGNSYGTASAKGAMTYPSTTDWFIAGIEILDDGLKLYVNNEYYADMCDLSDSFVSTLFAGINPFSTHPKKLIFDFGVTKPTEHSDGDWESTIMVDYVRFYAPESTTADACNITNQQEITGINVVIPGNRNIIFTDNGIEKIQAHSKFMANIETTPHTELLGYNFVSDNTDIITACSSIKAIGLFALKEGTANVTFTHIASGKSKTISFTVAQNMKGKVNCSSYELGDVNIGESKYWIADVSNTDIVTCITNGKFVARPSTIYALEITGGSLANAYNSKFRYIALNEYNSENVKIATTVFDSKEGTITTNENTAFVEIYCKYVDGKNFTKRDYFDMLDIIQCVNIVKAENVTEIVSCTNVSLDQTEITFDGTSESITLTATVEPTDCTQDVVWGSQNNCVSVNNGVITGNALGTDYVTVSCGDCTATCKVVVTGLYSSEATDTPSLPEYDTSTYPYYTVLKGKKSSNDAELVTYCIVTTKEQIFRQSSYVTIDNVRKYSYCIKPSDETTFNYKVFALLNGVWTEEANKTGKDSTGISGHYWFDIIVVDSNMDITV